MKFILHFILLLSFFKSFSQEKDLSYFMDHAQKNSPLLIDYKNQIQSTKLDSLVNLAARKPQINANLFGNYAPILNNLGYDNTITNGQTFYGLVGFNQKLLSKNRINTQSQTYKLIREGLVLNKKIALKDLNKTIISQYISASATSDLIFYNQKIDRLLNEEAVILKKMAQNSIYKQTDYLLFSATVKQQDLILLGLKQQYQNDLGLLYYLSGETDTSFVHLKKPEIILRSELPLDKSIFFKTFQTDSLKLKNQDKLIDNAYKPSISLLGDAGYMSTFANLPYKNFGLSLGFGISIPIYDGNQRDLQHQKTAIALATNLGYKSNFSKQYQQQLLILNQKLKQVSEIDQQLKSQVQISEALIEANKKLLLSGDAQITEFLLAISYSISIQNSISQNDINKLQLINEINYWSLNE